MRSNEHLQNRGAIHIHELFHVILRKFSDLRHEDRQGFATQMGGINPYISLDWGITLSNSWCMSVLFGGLNCLNISNPLYFGSRHCRLAWCCLNILLSWWSLGFFATVPTCLNEPTSRSIVRSISSGIFWYSIPEEKSSPVAMNSFEASDERHFDSVEDLMSFVAIVVHKFHQVFLARMAAI